MILRRGEGGCVFLDGNDCTVYEARPGNCERFPHLLRGAGSLESRMWDFVGPRRPIAPSSSTGSKR